MHHTKIEQIISVIDYIESHLSEKLDLKSSPEQCTIQNITCTGCSLLLWA